MYFVWHSDRVAIAFKLTLALFVLNVVVNNSDAAENKQYEIGESLQKQQVSKRQSRSSYENLEWEALSPKDWDPLEAVKGLDLETLDDADPKAVEAMIAVGEAWKNAPVIPSLNGQRVRISGFVVPLDINRNKVKEFLLVPYFGACIHIPPPPGNQTIHAINANIHNQLQNDILKDAAMVQGPVTIAGVLETVHSTTEMGAAGYKIQIESIEQYLELRERND